MLELDSIRWHELSHAYGKSSDIPELLRKLEAADQTHFEDADAEPWFSLWSALCHQGDIYTATYAAVPHIIRIALGMEETPHWQYFVFLASVEIARLRHRGPEIPPDISDSYFAAVQSLHDLAYKIAEKAWSEPLGSSIASALLVSKGHVYLAETIMEMSTEELREFRRYQGIEDDDS